MDRRGFLRAAATTGALTSGVGFGPGFWRSAFGAPAAPGPGPYGPLVESEVPGLFVPEGFSARIVAVAGLPLGVTHSDPGLSFIWPPFPDGSATFATDDGGWVLAVNSEVPRASVARVALGLPVDGVSGGCSAIRFAPDGTVVDGYSILTGTDGNCAGGKTPWGTWISCEEPQLEPFSPTNPDWALGSSWECDPFQPGQGVARDAMGLFKHEGCAVDPVNGHVFLTEDESDGVFYRFIPDGYPDLSSGTLQAAIVAENGSVTWGDVADPLATQQRTANQVAGATRFDGGEGIWYDEGYVYFTTKNDHIVWVHDIANQTIFQLFNAADHAEPVLGPLTPDDTSVDNCTVAPSGDLYVAEDGGDMELVIISADKREVAAVTRLVGDNHAGSEVTGPSFSPDGTRLYFSSQRGSTLPIGTEDPTGQLPIFGNGFGVTYEVSGPFRTERVGIAAVGSSGQPEPMTPPVPREPPLPATGGGSLVVAAAAIASAEALRRRGSR
ncbi:MAG: DUF839 domain-containing protein [Nitriliruptorales bacterium]|nr:DUF839 domain-containing protein [Nitriliruptorales bacterium]